LPNSAKEGWNGCFRRVYNAAHLAAYPGQTVTSIAVSMKPSTSLDFWYGRPWIANAQLIITVRGKKMKYLGYNADCVATAGGLDCPMEEDAGTFTLARWGAGVKIVVTQDLRLNQAGQASDESNGPFVRVDNPEDRTFLLPPAPAGGCK
jgi:hypothetical protein